ncbi:MAG TPA: SRPBCC family protein [Gemmataceae bacterium]
MPEPGAFDPAKPLAAAHTIPSTWYRDPGLYERERETVFAGTWQMVGLREAVASPGSYLTADVAGEPVVVVRDGEGELRAFFNVCRHRAALLLTEPCGQASRVRCRYHGWTYDLAGRLRGTPDFEGVEDFAKEDNGLVPVHVALWGPWVWVHLTAPERSLEEHLAPLPRWAAGRGIDALRYAGRREYELACNWKVFVDNYLDGGYHVNTVHPGLAGALDYSGYRTEVYETTNVQLSPLRPPEGGADATRRVRTGTEAAYWWVFPNLMINIYEGVMDTNLVLPLGPERCRVIFDFFFAESLGEDFRNQSMEVAHQIQLEDLTICEEVQRGLRSRSYSTGRFSVKREAGAYHFHQLLARKLAG